LVNAFIGQLFNFQCFGHCFAGCCEFCCNGLPKLAGKCECGCSRVLAMDIQAAAADEASSCNFASWRGFGEGVLRGWSDLSGSYVPHITPN
jgi:hypothetical protein